MKTETPDTVHGRLMEAVHIAGYTFERVCGELEWLLEKDRWKLCGQGYKNINAFMDTLVEIKKLRQSIEQRQSLVRKLAALGAGQRATARLVGVDKGTIRGDLGLTKRRGDNSPPTDNKTNKTSDISKGNGEYSPDAWFQTEADPTREAKRLVRNEQREEERAQLREERPSRSLPAGKYCLLYADPPWQYEHVVTESRAIENQYPTMTLQDICALQIPAADDAVLYLWATSPKLAEAITVIQSWGFSYRTCAVWDKGVIGMGYYFRQQHELLLVAARGSLPAPDPSNRPPSLITIKRQEHSAKPAFVYELLETMYPTFTETEKVELFARSVRPGWASWGNEV